jgi:SagB-type dehydrogenase family enzyme
MKIEWASRVGERLRPAPADGLAALYHENSKLSASVAGAQAARFAATPFELHLTSRGFHQFRTAPAVPLPPAADSPLAPTLRHRRSRRELDRPLALPQLATLLQTALGITAIAEDATTGVAQAMRAWPSAGGLYPLEAYVVAQTVSGLEPGVYHHNAVAERLEQLPARAPRAVLERGFFWQEFATTAALAILLVAVFERSLTKYGERGYRLVVLDAGHAAQNLLLVAEALELPAVAIAGFCDDALADDLGLDGVEEAVLHTVLIGGCADD